MLKRHLHLSIGLGALSVLTTLITLGCGGDSDQPPTPSVPKAKNIILVIGDGMQLNHEIAASRYLTGKDQSLAWHSLDYSTYCSTWDVDTYNDYAKVFAANPYDPANLKASIGYSVDLGGAVGNPLDQLDRLSYFKPEGLGYFPATDSASAGTAMASGYKTNGGVLNWLPGTYEDKKLTLPDTGGNNGNNGSLKTIAEMARAEKAMAIGVVSTVPFNHATPAAFVSHSKSRNFYYAGYKGATTGIADEIIQKTKPDVVIGGGHPLRDNPDYLTTKGYISKSLHEELRASKDFILAERQEGKDGGQVLLAAAEKAIKEKKKLFGLFGGKGGNFEYHVPVHAPGLPSVKKGSTENPNLHEATSAAIKVLSQNKNGFFLMVEQGDIDWANHANDYKGMIGCMHDLNETVKGILANPSIDWNNTLLIVTSDHGNSYMRVQQDKVLAVGEIPEDLKGYITYGTDGHTNELVTLRAKGPKAALDKLKHYESKWYNKPILDNTHIFHAMADFLGISKPSPLKVEK